MIGIHLGANYTRVAIMKDSYPIMVREIDIPRDGNADRLASVVSFRNNQIRFGTEAFKTQDHEIIFDACRAAPHYKSDIWHAKRSSDGKYTVRGLSENNGTISQEEVISKILTRIRDIVEAKYGDNFIQSVILSYPPECIQTYQDMLKKAAKNAFNTNVELLEEREAAAKTFYKLSPPNQDPHHLLVFKFGAGSFGISVFEKKNDENDFKQLESTSDPNMGGEDITNSLIWHCQKEFKEKLEESEVRNKQLRESCERVKSDLSYFAETKIFLDGDPLCDFTRNNFESLLKVNDIIENIKSGLQTIAEKIQNQGIKINDVLLVGGSTRLHFIRNLIDTALNTFDNTEYRYDTVVNPEEAIAMGCAIFSDNLKDVTNSPIQKIPNNSPEEKENSPSSIKEDENVTEFSSDSSTDLDIEANETTPLTNLQPKSSMNPKSLMNPLNLSQSNLNNQNFNTKYDTYGTDDKNKLSEHSDDHVKNLKTVQTNSTSNISIELHPTRTSINDEGNSQVEETRQEEKSQEEESQEKKRQKEKRQEEERQKKKKQEKKRQTEEKILEKKSQEEKRQEEESQEKQRQEKRLDEYEETCMKPDEIDMPRSSTKKEKSQIKQNLKYENIEKTVHSKRSTASSASSESSNYKTKPTDKTKGLNNDHGHLIVKGNFSNHTKETLYNQINNWLDSIIKFKHISSVEKEHFANTYGKTAINKLPHCTGDEVLLMDLVARAELRYQTLKYKNDILEQFNKIKDALGYIKENKKFLDKLNEKRKEVEETSLFIIMDTACDACINDLHQLLGILQAELKRPPRSENTKVSKWQEDELVKVLIKPQIHQCVYTKGH